MGYIQVTETYDYNYDDYTGEEIQPNDLCIVFRPFQPTTIAYYKRKFDEVYFLENYNTYYGIMSNKEHCFKIINTNNPVFKHLPIFKE